MTAAGPANRTLSSSRKKKGRPEKGGSYLFCENNAFSEILNLCLLVRTVSHDQFHQQKRMRNGVFQLGTWLATPLPSILPPQPTHTKENPTFFLTRKRQEQMLGWQHLHVSSSMIDCGKEPSWNRLVVAWHAWKTPRQQVCVFNRSFPSPGIFGMPGNPGLWTVCFFHGFICPSLKTSDCNWDHVLLVRCHL